jgi:predicted nucleotidyltransferase
MIAIGRDQVKTFTRMALEQADEVRELRGIARAVVDDKVRPNPKILGALLTGSVARGDARVGPHGLDIDLALLVERRGDLDLDTLFGPSVEPFIPFHCIKLRDKIGLAIELIEKDELWAIRDRKESDIFAKNEALILDDKTGVLAKWKSECFAITDEQVRARALQWFFRFGYLCGGDYRFEKWMHREAWTQLCQNFNEAGECYCSFLHCVNRRFIPRKDWLAYLTYELPLLPPKHEEYMAGLYTSSPDQAMVCGKQAACLEIPAWMEGLCKEKSWL